MDIEIRKEENGMILEINSTEDFEVVIRGKKQKITAGKNVFNI